MLTHEERIKELEAQGVHVMKPEVAQRMFENICKRLGIRPEEFPDDDTLDTLKDGAALEEYIDKKRRGIIK